MVSFGREWGVSDSDEYFDYLFRDTSVMTILRGYSPAETVAWAERSWDLGVQVVEVPVERDEAYASLAAAVEAARGRGLTLGAGTVYRSEQVDMVVELGAAFAVAPGFDAAVSERCRERGLPYLPGVASATEVQAALRAGHRWLKVFPARELGTEWIRAIRAPFPLANFVATGGIDASNARAFLDAGARAVAVGSALHDPAQLDRLSAIIARSTRN